MTQQRLAGLRDRVQHSRRTPSSLKVIFTLTAGWPTGCASDYLDNAREIEGRIRSIEQRNQESSGTGSRKSAGIPEIFKNILLMYDLILVICGRCHSCCNRPGGA